MNPERDDAFTCWARAAAPQLERIARLLCGDRHTGQDLVQDVLERMYPRWARIGDPDAYARRALAHAVTSRWRYRARRPEASWDTSSPGRDAPPEFADPHSATGALEHRLDLLAALAHLPARQRAVIVLRYLEDRSERDVADLLDISVGTVKSQTVRALTRLRAAGLRTSDSLDSRSTR